MIIQTVSSGLTLLASLYSDRMFVIQLDTGIALINAPTQSPDRDKGDIKTGDGGRHGETGPLAALL